MSLDPVLQAHARRDAERDRLRYAPWNPAERLLREERSRVAAMLLHRAGRFPQRGTAVLEVGYGRLGWLTELLSWGLASADLHGIELDPERAAHARDAVPGADLRVGDAGQLPWPDACFGLVVVSTVLSSVLDAERRRAVAAEIERVVAPTGAVLWYDFAWNNPRNRDVRGISRRELRGLFPVLTGPVRSVSLAPPLARLVAPRMWWLANLLQAFPPLRSHLLGVLGRDLRGGR